MANDIIEIEDRSSPLLETTAEKYEAIESELTEIQENLGQVADKLAIQIPVAIQLADSAQDPKTYEALAKLVTAFAGLNKEAANVIKQKQELYDSFRKKEPTNNSQINNDNRSVNFHGTTTELLDHILKK